MTMQVVIRTDSSRYIGSGHLMRCLTLADLLREKGASVFFISRDLEGNVARLAVQKGYLVHVLPAPPVQTRSAHSSRLTHGLWLGVDWETDANETNRILRDYGRQIDWLIVDHYALDYRWEKNVRACAAKIMVIDDIADRRHDCDVILDQNYYQGMETRYRDLVPSYCVQFLGPSYTLLRAEFIEARKTLRKRDGTIKRILIFYGGSDPTNETTKALNAISMLDHADINIDVVVGGTNVYRESIKRRCASMVNTEYHCQVDNMAELMILADLAIGGGGTTTWERCYLGLPAVVVTIAENQTLMTETLASAGGILFLGNSNDVQSNDISSVINKLIDEPDLVASMSKKASEVIAPRKDALLLNFLLGGDHGRA